MDEVIRERVLDDLLENRGFDSPVSAFCSPLLREAIQPNRGSSLAGKLVKIRSL
jgi:hypothetical protein